MSRVIVPEAAARGILFPVSGKESGEPVPVMAAGYRGRGGEADFSFKVDWLVLYYEEKSRKADACCPLSLCRSVRREN